MLFDKDFRLQFLNRQVMEFQNYPPDIIKPGISGQDILRYPGEARRFRPGQGRRGEGARAGRAGAQAGRKPVPAPHARRPLCRVQLPAARRRRTARLRPRRHLAEGARGGARRRQGGRRARARRRRAHPRGDADRARQHERRRDVVGQGLPLDVLEPLQRRHVGLQGGHAGARRVRLRHDPRARRAGRIRADRRRREDRDRGDAAHPAAGRRALRAARPRRANTSSSISGR